MTSSVLRETDGVKTSFGGRVGCSTFVSMNMLPEVPPPQPNDGIATAATATTTSRPAIMFFICSLAFESVLSERWTTRARSARQGLSVRADSDRLHSGGHARAPCSMGESWPRSHQMRRSPHACGGFLLSTLRFAATYMTSSVLRDTDGVKTSFGGRVGCSTFVSMNMLTDVPPPQPN